MWKPIQNLTPEWQLYRDSNLETLAEQWIQQHETLKNLPEYQHFQEKLRRRIAIETGVLERLYTIDRGTTALLIEQGFDIALLAHDKTDRDPAEVLDLINDQERAIEAVQDYVGQQRDLSTSFIKQLQQLLTRNQDYTDAIDQFGKRFRAELLRGDWKKTPNNPNRPDGTLHVYCPPEQVASQMDQLITWHMEHLQSGVSPEVEAAWLHHRFTEIHPFQDGNGRVARLLASLVFIRARWFPLLVENDQRLVYIQALEKADAGDLMPLIELFAAAQRKAFLATSLLATESIPIGSSQAMISAVLQRFTEQNFKQSEVVAKQSILFEVALKRFKALEGEFITSATPTIKHQLHVGFDYATYNDKNSADHALQIIETAKALNYGVNLNSPYKNWLRLSISLNNTSRTEILLSLHHIGREAQQVMACSACVYQRLNSEETSSIQNLIPLTPEPFIFTDKGDINTIVEAYKKWLEEAIIVAISYWANQI